MNNPSGENLGFMAKILEREGASHHPAFMGSFPTVSHMPLALSSQWTNSPTWGQSKISFYCFVFGVNKEN